MTMMMMMMMMMMMATMITLCKIITFQNNHQKSPLSENNQQELSNEYQHDRVKMFFKNRCILVLWTKVASSLKGLSSLVAAIAQE